MKKLSFVCLTVLVGLFSCKPAQIPTDSSHDMEAMPVKGRNGLQIGQVISYGDYKTSKIKRGWTKGYDYPFIVHFYGAKEKLSFKQFGPDSYEAEVSCISKFKSTELSLVKGYFNIPLKVEHFFAGSVATARSRPTWDFILYNPNGDFLKKQKTAGYAKNGDEEIEINAVRGLEGQPDWMQKLGVYGYEFLYDGKIVGLVSTVNKGTVWIDESLDGELRTVIASIATGLLLRNDVEDAADLG